MVVKNIKDIKTYVDHGAILEKDLLHKNSDKFLLWFRFFSLGIVKPGDTVEEHSHSFGEEIWYVLKGEGVMQIDGQERTVTKGDMVYVSFNETHCFTNTGTEDFEIIAVGAQEKVAQNE